MFTRLKDFVEIKINSSNTAIQYNLGLVYLNSGQSDKAREEFSNILKVDPKNQDAANALKQIGTP